MATSFRDSLPEEFVKNTISLCGERGRLWLDGLPDLITVLQDRWGIVASEPFPNIGYNYVAAAETHDGTPFVLKIGLPGDNIVIFSESQYLRILERSGSIQALEGC